jgi:hypothetical protein
MRLFVFVLTIAGIGLAFLWNSKANAPHISEAQADAIALGQVQRFYRGPARVTSAVYIADGGRSESKPGEQWPGQNCGILPQAICPPTPLWVVHVHTTGFGDSIWTINATNAQVLLEVGAH